MFPDRAFELITDPKEFGNLSVPMRVFNSEPYIKIEERKLNVLRMLVKPKYGSVVIPEQLRFLRDVIHRLQSIDSAFFLNSWVYVTVRHGKANFEKDDEFHYDGASFNFRCIPERNYIYANSYPTEYVEGRLEIPNNFDPFKMNLHEFAAKQAIEKDLPIKQIKPKQFYMIDPFCLHRRPSISTSKTRTFIRVSFTDVEIRDINNTPNPLISTEFYGRDGVKMVRDKLK